MCSSANSRASYDESPRRQNPYDASLARTSAVSRSLSFHDSGHPLSPSGGSRGRSVPPRRAEDSSTRVVDLAGRREQFPRPPGDISAECVYRVDAEQEAQTPTRTNSQRREEVANREKNAGRQFLWPTTDSVITKAEQMGSNPFPLALICCPFADGAGDSTTLPLSDVGSEEPLRCPRCRAYVNAHCRWGPKSGDRLQCSMCDHLIEVPKSFLDDMDRAGQCADEDNHPELVFGSVDFTAPGHYDVDRPVGPSEQAVCVLLETSSEAIRTGFVAASIDAIRRLLGSREYAEDIPPIGRRVALVTFDDAVHFFALGKNGRYHAIGMRELEDPYIPVGPQALFVDPRNSDQREMLLTLLDELEQNLPARLNGTGDLTFGGADGVATGPALKLAAELLSQVGGGDVIGFHASNPTLGLGAIRPDDDAFCFGAAPDSSPPASPLRTSSRWGTWSPTSASTPAAMVPTSSARRASGVGAATPSTRRATGTPATGMHASPPQQPGFYEDVLAQCIRGGVAVSCVTSVGTSAPREPLDVTTLQWLPWRTGGDTLHLPAFSSNSCPLLRATVLHWVEKMQASAYGCVVKLRTSKGLGCKSLIAAWPAAVSADDKSAFEIPRLSPDVSFAFALNVEPEPEQEQDPYVYKKDTGRKQLCAQVAVLYTNVKGERLLRVHNCAMGIVQAPRAIYNSVSIAPLMALLIKQCASMALEKKEEAKTLPRDALLEFCLQILVAYHRQHNYRAPMDEGQLVLGRKLQLFPLYILGARKLIYTATNGSMDKHMSAEFLRRLLRMPMHSLLSAIYPRTYSLHPTPHASRDMPRAGFSSKDYLASGNAPAYLVVNCFGAWFYYSPPEGSDDGDDGGDGLPIGDASPDTRKSCGAMSASTTPTTATPSSLADPERTPETWAVERAELWKSAEVLTQKIRESLSPGPLWMPLCELPRLPNKLSTDMDVDWNTKIFFSAIFVEDEGVNEMDYIEWMRYIHTLARRMTIPMA